MYISRSGFFVPFKGTLFWSVLKLTLIDSFVLDIIYPAYLKY